MIKKIDRRQYLDVCGYLLTGQPLASQTLDNRLHLGQIAFAYGVRVPSTQGQYAGCDPFALALLEALAVVVPRKTAAQIVRDEYEIWERGLARVEWPADAPPVVPTVWAQTKPAIEESISPPPPDFGIHFGIALPQRPDGTFVAASGTLTEISFAIVDKVVGGATRTFTVNLGGVLAAVREAATKAQVDLGTFTRLETHPDYVAWRVAVGKHQQQCEDRLKTRRLPGPPRAKAKRRKRVRATREAEAKTQREQA